MSRDAPNTAIRVAARLANRFALDLIKLTGFGRDVVDGLLLSAISQANLAQVARSPDLQRRYATLNTPPPDELRRPVSVSAIANSLQVPFETARRRIAALSATGLVIQTPRGVTIPTAPVNSETYRAFASAQAALVRDLYLRLRRIDLLADLPAQTGPAFDPADPPVRLVVRLSSDYLLRLAEPISTHIGDMVSGLILMEIINANTEHLGDDEGGTPGPEWTAEGFVPDAMRRPVRAAALSSRLGVASETVRRRLSRLATEGLCERNGDGYLIPAQVLARENFVRFMTDNQSHLNRLFTALAEFGVLSQWEAEESGVRGAA
ncbi:hypothetical protein [Phenylobacterium sp. SCN 70-31]|uniref:hypothetical protein n=1 Tax=Phenylobacterium sp. SCN 70-31 TaxID=1660129 RepID=UPI00086F9DA4|nr:hypothetical protein [Phenylobacterium sp. SCN 70-31]ODT89773.1 MAG: hypothetical protein ABS78_00075 [Phenylobacterium sp. SCN 70-31]